MSGLAAVCEISARRSRSNPWARRVSNEHGVALPVALFALVSLSGLLLAFLSLATMEPTIAQNQDASTRALHIAEAGLELALSQLA